MANTPSTKQNSVIIDSISKEYPPDKMLELIGGEENVDAEGDER